MREITAYEDIPDRLKPSAWDIVAALYGHDYYERDPEACRQARWIVAARLAALEPDPPQTSGYVRTEDDLKQPLPEGTLTVGSHDNTVPEGLKEAVRGAWESIAGRACLADNYWKELGCEGTQQMVIERILAAVKRYYEEHDNRLEVGYQRLIDDNDKLKKQIEHQREIHDANLSAFDNINNVLHEKIAALKEQLQLKTGILSESNEAHEKQVVQWEAEKQTLEKQVEELGIQISLREDHDVRSGGTRWMK